MSKMLVDTAVSGELFPLIPNQSIKAVWELMKAKASLGATLVTTEASWIDNPVIHYAMTNDPDTLKAMLEQGNIVIHLYAGKTPAETFSVMYGKKFYHANLSVETTLPKALTFEEIVSALQPHFPEGLSDQYKASYFGLFKLANDFALGNGTWDMNPGWPKYTPFTDEELKKFHIPSGGAEYNRSTVRAALMPKYHMRYVKYLEAYTANLKRQHKCTSVFGFAELHELLEE